LPLLDAINYGSRPGQLAYGYAGGGMVQNVINLSSLERKLDALNMNVANLELAVTVVNNAPDLKTQVERHEIAKAREISRGKVYNYGV